MVTSADEAHLAPYVARLLSVIAFDHLIRHPVLTLGDHDDERLVDEAGALLDVDHPAAEESIDWFFRVSRRHEVLWFELGLDPGQPRPPVLRARRPDGRSDLWTSAPELPLAQQLSQCLAQWLAARRLPLVGPLPAFSLADLRLAAARLAETEVDLGASLTPPTHVPIPFLRVLAELSRDEARTFDPIILRLDPTHLVARRNRYVAGLVSGEVDRRDVLPLIGEAPMYAKPHLSIWGEPFAADRVLENMGVRHQGIAASLMPANPYACHNYSLQLAEVGRREESFRWADRATVAAPQFGAAHLDCVRRLRQVGRPGQAYAEAQYRYREIHDRANGNKLATTDWQAPHHAALLVAFVHLDIGRLAEAIELAETALARLPSDAPSRDAFAWAHRRVQHWKHDAALFARAYAWEAHHRGDPGRVIAGIVRGGVTDDVDAMMLIDALVSIGRDDQAEIAFWLSADVLGDGKARLAGAKALILRGNVDEALDQIQTVQLRRGQSRLEAEVNRMLRLAVVRPATDWERAIEMRLERGAATLARSAARDLADFIPGLDTPVVRRALGERPTIRLDETWLSELIAALPAAGTSAGAIATRLARPATSTLAAADALAQDWWSALVPPARDRDAHAAGTILALGIAIAHYFVATSGAPTPIAGGYRHVATEALHLVRRSRYQIDVPAIRALLALFERLAAAGAEDWLLDIWLMRVERALDLEAEHGSYLEGMVAGLPRVARLLRGDERIGWELRLAHDLAADPTQYEPAAMLFERCARAVEAGGAWSAWSAAVAAATPRPARAVQLDVHWLAALANPTAAGPWLRLAQVFLGEGDVFRAFPAACRGMAAATPRERVAAAEELAPLWHAAKVATPLEGAAAFEAGLAAASEQRPEIAVQHLRWAAAVEPTNARRAHSLATALGQLGRGLEAVRVLAQHERADAPRAAGRALLEAKHHAEAVPLLRYASRRFRAAEDWRDLAMAASACDNDVVAVEAGREAMLRGARDATLLVAMARGLSRMGEFVACEEIAQQLIAETGGGREVRAAGLHAMARALAGQGRHVDAHPYAKAAEELGPDGELGRELVETMDRIVAQEAPPVRPSMELSLERLAYNDLEAGRFDVLMSAVASPSWGIARAALAACEFRRADENGIPVATRALDGAAAILARSDGVVQPEAVLARIRALRIRDNAFIQIDPPPPLGARYATAEFEAGHAERERRPRRATSTMSMQALT